MSQIDKWKEARRPGRGVRQGRPKANPDHAQLHDAPTLPKSSTVHDLRVEGEVDLSIFDDLQPDQDFMINPTGAVADDIYTVEIDPVSGKIGVQSTDPTTITTAPPDYSQVLSDGGTPSTPTATLVPGPGWIKVKWSASTGTSDPLRYKVFMRASAAPTTTDDTYLVADTHNLESIIQKLTGGTELDDSVTYHVKVKAYSRVAGGGTSAESADATASPGGLDASITTISHLDASTIDTGTLSASFISTGTLSADVTISGIIKTASSGARLEFDDTGFRQYDGGSTDYGAPSGAGITSEIPTSGDPFFRGDLRARSLQLEANDNTTPSTVAQIEWVHPSLGDTTSYVHGWQFNDEGGHLNIKAKSWDAGANASVNIGTDGFGGKEATMTLSATDDAGSSSDDDA